MGPAFLQRLGHPHHSRRRGALQPDVVPQRLDLAARQRPDRRRHGALRPHRERDAAVVEHVRRQPALRPAPPAGAVLRVRPARRRRARPCTRWPARRRPGPPRPCSACCRPASAWRCMPQAPRSCCARRGCRRSSSGSASPASGAPGPSVDLLLQRYERNVGFEVVRKDPGVQRDGCSLGDSRAPRLQRRHLTEIISGGAGPS